MSGDTTPDPQSQALPKDYFERAASTHNIDAAVLEKEALDFLRTGSAKGF